VLARVVLVGRRGQDEEDAMWDVGHDVCGQDEFVWLGKESHDGNEFVRVVLYCVLGGCIILEAMGGVEDKDQEEGVCGSG
jgi:hypothetical protein